MSNKNETKEEKKATKKEILKEILKDPNFKQLYDVWGLLAQIETQARFIRDKSKSRFVKDEALIMITRIEMMKQVYITSDNTEEKSDERSN